MISSLSGEWQSIFGRTACIMLETHEFLDLIEEWLGGVDPAEKNGALQIKSSSL
jgi:hypothetical protein